MFPEGAPASTARNMNQIFGTPIPEGATPDTVLAVHPTQLYETVLGTVMFLILWRFRKHKHAEGWLFGPRHGGRAYDYVMNAAKQPVAETATV